MDRECASCGMERSRHWGVHRYEEEFDVFGIPEVKTVEAHKPVGRKISWDDLLDDVSVSRRTEVEDPEPTAAKPKVSLKHTNMRLDGTDYICDACGAVSADFDLFEEVGAENECKPVEAVVSEEGRGWDDPEAKPKDDLHEMYKELLSKIGATERKAMARPIVWEKNETYIHHTDEYKNYEKFIKNQIMRKDEKRRR